MGSARCITRTVTSQSGTLVLMESGAVSRTGKVGAVKDVLTVSAGAKSDIVAPIHVPSDGDTSDVLFLPCSSQ